MNKEYFLSIIIPAFNCERTITKCLESIPNFDFIQIIIINDGSSDNTKNIIENYILNSKNENIKFINQKNKGVASSRNTGIEIAQGKYITFLDSDDFYNKDIFSKLIYEIENIEFDLFMFGIQWIDSKNNILRIERIISKEIVKTNDFVDDFLLGKISGYSCNKIFKKQILTDSKIRMKNYLLYMEDSLFVSEYLKYCHLIKNSDLVCYNYLQNNNSATHKIDINKIESLIESTKKTVMLYKNNEYVKYYKLFNYLKAFTMSFCVNNTELKVKIREEIKVSKNKCKYRLIFFSLKQKLIFLLINTKVLDFVISLYQKIFF